MGSFPREERVNCNFFPLFLFAKFEKRRGEWSRIFVPALFDKRVRCSNQKKKEGKRRKEACKAIKISDYVHARKNRINDRIQRWMKYAIPIAFIFFFSLFSTKKKRYFDVTQNRKHGSFLSDYLLSFRLPFRFVREFLAGVVFKRRNVEKKEKKVNLKLALHHVQSLIWSR